MKNKTISALAKSRISYNKSRSVLTAIAICLTTALLMGVATSAVGLFDISRQQAVAAGNHHAAIIHLDAKQVEMLNNHLDVEALDVKIQFASIVYDNMNGSLTSNNTLKEGIYHGTGNLTEGHFPQAPDEICGPPAFFERMDTEPVIGNKITIPFRVGGEGLIQTREFTICGLVSQADISKLDISDHRLAYSAAVSDALVEEYLAPEERDYFASVRLFGENRFTEDQMENAIREVCLDIGGDTDNIVYNHQYLMTMLTASAEIAAAVAIIGLLILFFSALVIYSIYYIGVITDVQEIGKLKALGASVRQVKRLFLSESMRLCAIAIPPGLLLGFGIPAILLPLIVDSIAKDSPFAYSNIEHYHMFSAPVLVGVAVSVLVTVRISLLKSLRIAGKISPVEAVRYQETSALAGTRKGRKNLDLFQLSLANLLRNRKRTVVTMVTMGLSCVLFMSFAATLNSMSTLDYARYSIPEGDFRLYLDGNWNDKEYPESNFDVLQQQNLFNDSLLKRIRDIDGVTDIGKSGYVLFSADSSAPVFENRTRNSLAPFSREEAKDMQKKITEGEIDYDKMLAENGVICTSYLDWEEMGLSIGDAITLTIHDGNREIPLTVSVSAVIKDSRRGFLTLPQELWDSLGLQFDPTCDLYISVEEEKYDSAKAALQEIAAENEHFVLYSLDEELQIGSSSINMIKYPLYALLIMVAVISFTNLINTMLTSIVTRKRELGILQAIGLSDRQLKKMLSLEGLVFTAGTLLISVTLGNLFGYLIFLYATKMHLMGLSRYHYPIRETIGLAAMLIVGQLFITALLNRKVHRESLIERIRSGE